MKLKRAARQTSGQKRTFRRRMIQVMSMLVYNADVKNWYTGTISQSDLKNVCVPGLNCYSCPGAVASCPIGSIQNTIANGRFPFFITGFLMIIGALFGRMICSYACPVGLIQELLYKIPVKKFRKTKKSRAVTRKLSLLKYAVLIILVIALPLSLYFKDGAGSPVFCSWVCPAGTVSAGIPLVILNESLRSAIGFLFDWKIILAGILIILSTFMFRPFCRFVCPLGAIYSFFNKSAVFGIKIDEKKCTHCGACAAVCKMDTLLVNDRECIRCGDCLESCHFKALHF
ncbi:MAG: 4Fe-4S binding protein [Treponema sp.]|nr:4Fe-4S binding protein [Treponema sp.]